MRSRDVLALADGLPDHETVRLLVVATDRSRSEVMLGFEVTSGEQDVFASLVARRLAHEPLQYIEGEVTFGPVKLHVDRRVLIPRPETEYLFELVVGLVDEPKVIVDLCTGSGNLALALKRTFPDASVYAVELSPDAATVAGTNARRNKLDIHVLVGDLFQPLPVNIRGAVDLVVSNPPYIALSELDGLPPDVLEEPFEALIAGDDQNDVLARIASEAQDWLAPEGLIACEISEFRSGNVAELFSEFSARIVQDLAGRDRYVLGRG